MATIQHSVPAAPSIAGERLPKRSIVGYGLGDFANNLAFTLGTTFLLYYYTDVAGMSAAAVATMFFVVRLWDAVTDIFAGRLVDRTMTRLGKFRPFILFGAVPLLFLSALTFHVPAEFDAATKLLYAYLTYAILGPVLLAGQHPLRLARLGDDPVGPPAGQARRLAVLRQRRRRHRPHLHHRAEDLRPPRREGDAQLGRPTAPRSSRSSPRPRCSSSSSARSPTASPSYCCREQVVRTQPRVSARADLGHDPSQQAARLPLRGELLLPHRPLRGRRRLGLLRPVRPRRHQVAGPDHAGQHRHLHRRGAVHPQARRPVRQEDDLPVLRPVHRRRRPGPVLPARPASSPRP